MSKAEDWELLDAWRGGDERSGAELVRRYVGLLTRFFHNKVRNSDDVADLVSDTMLACTQGRDRVDDAGAFRSYVFAAAMNQLRRHYRKSVKRKRELDDFSDVFVGEDSTSQSMTSMVSRQQETVLLVRGLRRLSLDQQIVLELAFLEGLEGAEIGELLGISKFTVYTRIRRGKARLAQIVEELAESPEQAQSTVMGLQTWAVKVRQELDGQQ
ncbi:MAG: sigma-70 family RNA polymerase sigma factor [Myxococcota bacterium]